jgi:hypothetical protein
VNLSTRLNNLEAKRKAFWCAWCRYSLKTTTRYPLDSPEPDHIKAKCWFCGNPYGIPTGGFSPKLKEAIAVVATSHPTRQFIDERVHTAKLWIDFFSCMPLSPYYQGTANVPAPGLSKRRQLLKAAAEAYHGQQMERFKLMVNGPESFPIDAALEKIKSACRDVTVPSDIPFACQPEAGKVIKEIARYLHIAKSSAACELVLWGQVLPETQAEITFFEREQLWKIGIIIAQELEQQEQRITSAKPTAHTSAPDELPRPDLQPTPEAPLKIKPFAAQLPESPYEVSLPMVEEETPLQRTVKLVEEAQQQKKREREELLRRLAGGYSGPPVERKPVTLPNL